MESVLATHERVIIRSLRERIPVLNHVSADKIIVGIGTTLAVVWAWAAEIDLAAWTAGIGILSVAVGAGISGIIQKIAQTKIEIARAEHRAKLEMAAEQAKWDQENSGSVLVQLGQLKGLVESNNETILSQQKTNDGLQAAVEALTASLDETKSRVKDANDKLHKIREQAQADSLQHTDEIQNLQAQHTKEMSAMNAELARVTRSLEEANGKLKMANESLDAMRKENAELKKATAGAVATGARNSEAIEATRVRVDQLSGGDSGATPIVTA